MISDFFDNPGYIQTVLEELPVGIYIVDRERRIRFWNRGAELIIGHMAHEVVGRLSTEHIVDARDGHGSLLADASCPVTATLRDGQPRQLTAHFLHKEGHRVPVAIRCRAIRHRDATEGAIVLFEDMADLRHNAEPPSPYGYLDPMTGIPAHRLTRALLAESMAAMEESGRGFGVLRIRVLGLRRFSLRSMARIPLCHFCAPRLTRCTTCSIQQAFWAVGARTNSSRCCLRRIVFLRLPPRR